MSKFRKSHITRKCAGKMPQTKASPTLCASLRSGNACQHLTRATLCRLRNGNACQHLTRATLHGSLQRGPKWAPWSSTGLYTYRKNPSSVDTWRGELKQLYINEFTIKWNCKPALDKPMQNVFNAMPFAYWIPKPCKYCTSNCKNWLKYRLVSICPVC